MGSFIDDYDLRYNRFINLDNIEWKLIEYLVNDESKYANYLWKMLKYDTPDCLLKEDLTKEQKLELVYTGNGESSEYRVFMGPFLDDTWDKQSAQLHIYLHALKPMDRIKAKAIVCFEIIVHNKVVNIIGDASEYNGRTNPVELDKETNRFYCPYKDRSVVMLKSVLGALNGKFVNGVGNFMFDLDTKSYNQVGVKSENWNSRKFMGYELYMETETSGTSVESKVGY